MIHTPLSSSLLLVCLFCTAACAGQEPTRSDADTHAADTNGTDSASDADNADTATDVSEDASDSARDTTLEEDTSEPLDFDASLWKQERECEAVTIDSPVSDQPFSIPDRPLYTDPIKTRSEWIERVGQNLQAYAVYPANSLQPGDGKPFGIYSTPGTSASFHLYVQNTYTPEELESFRLNVTALVDYEEVEASYVVWNEDRTEKRVETVSTGINYDITQDVEIVDITVPGAVLEEPGVREITVLFKTNTTERRSIGGGHRFYLYNGSFERDFAVCHEPRLDAPWTDIEEALRGRAGGIGPLFFAGIDDPDALRRTIDIAPGQTMEFFFSVFRTTNGKKPTPTVLIPTLNGRPLEQRWWVTQGQAELGAIPQRAEARKSFTLTMPEEPGIYEVQVMNALDPFKLYKTPDGDVVEDIYTRSTVFSHTNALRFRVVEPQD